MTMNRRQFLTRMAAAGIVSAVPEIIIPEKRFWQLDRTMVKPDFIHVSDELVVEWISLMGEDRFPILTRYPPYESEDMTDFVWSNKWIVKIEQKPHP